MNKDRLPLTKPPTPILNEGGEKLTNKQIRQRIEKDADNTMKILREMLKE